MRVRVGRHIQIKKIKEERENVVNCKKQRYVRGKRKRGVVKAESHADRYRCLTAATDTSILVINRADHGSFIFLLSLLAVLLERKTIHGLIEGSLVNGKLE
jgi:hypothetical protein